MKVARWVGGVAGCSIVIWGTVLAALEQQPGLVLIAGFGLIVAGLVGADWSKIVAKIGGSEVSIVRQKIAQAGEAVQKSLAEAAAEVLETPGVPEDVRDKLVDRLEEAQDEAAQAVSDIESGPKLAVIAGYPGRIGFMVLNVADKYLSSYQIVVESPSGNVERSVAPKGTMWPLRNPEGVVEDGTYSVRLEDAGFTRDSWTFEIRDGRVMPRSAKRVLAFRRPSS